MKNAPFKFRDTNPKQFFSNHGWQVFEDLHLMDEARRIGKRPPSSAFPMNVLAALFAKKMIKTVNDTYGYVMFSKQGFNG